MEPLTTQKFKGKIEKKKIQEHFKWLMMTKMIMSVVVWIHVTIYMISWTKMTEKRKSKQVAAVNADIMCTLND